MLVSTLLPSNTTCRRMSVMGARRDQAEMSAHEALMPARCRRRNTFGYLAAKAAEIQPGIPCSERNGQDCLRKNVYFRSFSRPQGELEKSSSVHLKCLMTKTSKLEATVMTAAVGCGEGCEGTAVSTNVAAPWPCARLPALRSLQAATANQRRIVYTGAPNAPHLGHGQSS